MRVCDVKNTTTRFTNESVRSHHVFFGFSFFELLFSTLNNIPRSGALYSPACCLRLYFPPPIPLSLWPTIFRFLCALTKRIPVSASVSSLTHFDNIEHPPRFASTYHFCAKIPSMFRVFDRMCKHDWLYAGNSESSGENFWLKTSPAQTRF